jgi:DNA-binding NtrC family response regulator
MKKREDRENAFDFETSSPRGARVLIADDDSAMRRLLIMTLCRDGYEVCEARSGEELLWASRSMTLTASPWDAFDLVITDIRMPGLSGLDVLRKLRADRYEGPVVVMTAFPDARVVAEVGRLDAALLPKPFSLTALSRLVLSLFQPRLDERELGPATAH